MPSSEVQVVIFSNGLLCDRTHLFFSHDSCALRLSFCLLDFSFAADVLAVFAKAHLDRIVIIGGLVDGLRSGRHP